MSLAYTFYKPHPDPTLRKEEKEALQEKEGHIKRLYLARPAFLLVNGKGEVTFQEVPSIKTHYLVAELTKSDRLVLFESHEIFQMPVQSTKYYIDVYFNPLFGGFGPKEMLFVPIDQKEGVAGSSVIFSVNHKKT